MKDSQLLSSLQDLGLSEKEACVYYAALSLGPTSILKISRQAGVKRSTVYSIIESLKEKKLIRKELRGIKESYIAEDPERLKLLLERRQQSLLDILPQLSALQHLEGAESVIKYYEGLSAVKDVYLDLVASTKIGGDYLVLSDVDRWRRLAPDFFDAFTRRRGTFDIKVRMILVTSPFAVRRKSALRQANEKTRLLPPGTVLTTNLVIIPDKVFIHQLEPPIMGIIIENNHIIRMHREMFELIWAGLKD